MDTPVNMPPENQGSVEDFSMIDLMQEAPVQQAENALLSNISDDDIDCQEKVNLLEGSVPLGDF